MRFLPAFVRRAVLLHRSRELVKAGDGRAALALLADPIFDGVPSARELAGEAQRLLPPEQNGTRASITELLAHLREERARRGGAVDAPSANAEATSSLPVPTTRESGPIVAFRLAVDDAGEFLVVAGEDFMIGHESSTRADLRFLAHIEREHARLSFTNDFHAGPAWRILPIAGARVTVRDRDVGPRGAVISDGDRVVLGKNLAFRLRAENVSSSSAVLELEHGLECHGAGRLLLLAPGPSGRVVIGPSREAAIHVAGLEHGVTLEITRTHSDAAETRLSIGCSGGIARGVRPGVEAASALSILVPPLASERFTFAARPASSAPFEIVVAPLEETAG